MPRIVAVQTLVRLLYQDGSVMTLQTPSENVPPHAKGEDGGVDLRISAQAGTLRGQFRRSGGQGIYSQGKLTKRRMRERDRRAQRQTILKHPAAEQSPPVDGA